ncbi:MAG: FAD-dependent oxidoreductase [Verrucomicrobiia bacterium]
MDTRLNRRDWMKATGLVAGAWATGAVKASAAETPGAGAAARAGQGSVVFQRTIPVRHEVDVFVAGGGPAGTAAAVAARSQGAKVYLAEGHSCLGGMGTAGRVPVFMQVSDGVNFLAGGFGKQVVERLAKEKGLRGPAHDIEALKRVYDAMVGESGAAFTFHTSLIGVEAEGGRISHVICAAPSGIFAVRAKVYIDATGNGDLAAWAGATFEKGGAAGQLMPGTLCSLWSDIDWKTWLESRPKGPQPDGHMLEKAFADRVFTVRDEHLTGMHRLGETLGAGNIGHTFDVDATDEVSLTKALVAGRKSLKEYERYYREYLKGFEKTRLVATGSLLGVRETRRIMGDYVLCLADYKKRATFPDEIGRYAYSIDIHPLRPGKDTYVQHRKEFDNTFRYGKGESYGIPYRILTPRGMENLLVAGRCVSADVMVHGSIRVMPGCFITGQAAGMAAAMAGNQNLSVHRLDVKDLQRRLKDFGAFLPNA